MRYFFASILSYGGDDRTFLQLDAQTSLCACNNIFHKRYVNRVISAPELGELNGKVFQRSIRDIRSNNGIIQ